MIRSLGCVGVAAGLVIWPAVAAAIAPPVIDPAATPPGTASPEQEMEQRQVCDPVFARDGSQFGDLPWSSEQLRLDDAHHWSNGDGVLVAVIDTGVNASPRVPAEPGGDYITEHGDGLSDCDAHGTLVASLIAARPDPGDKIIGVAPGARIVSIRHTSRKFSPRNAHVDPNDPNQSEAAGSVRALARAVVHAADLGAKVINISETVCLRPAEGVDQAMLGAAIRHAVVDKDAVVVAAAGNTSEDRAIVGSCNQNQPPTPSNPSDPAGWGQVSTIVSPAWFAPLVLSVAALSPNGDPWPRNVSGPWAGVAAPGADMVALADGGRPVNAYPGRDGPVPLEGTSFAAPLVAGVAALVRAKYPQLSANQVVDRIVRTARHPGIGWDSTEGYGPVDPVAALTYDLPTAPKVASYTLKSLPPPPPPTDPDRGPVIAVTVGVAALVALAAGFTLMRKAARKA
jgi:membrane-anchored mycosin MYCP